MENKKLMKAQTFLTSVQGYDEALTSNCWYKGDGPADDIKIGMIMMIVVRPPRTTKKPQDYTTRPPILRKVINITPVSDKDVPEYLKSYFKQKGKVIRLDLEPANY